MTVHLRRTHGRYLWTPGETTFEKNGSEEAETLEAQNPKVNIDRLIWRMHGA
jgi:hypothetical protein